MGTGGHVSTSGKSNRWSVLAVLAFRSRIRRWWGLPLAAAGVALTASVIAGWGWHQVAEATVAAFLVTAAIRVAGRVFSRRVETPRR